MSDGALIFAGIIVGLAVADLLMSLHRLLKHRRRVEWDVLPLWLAGLVLVTLVQVWWSIAGARHEPLMIGQFLPMLVGLVFLFLLAAAVLPDDGDSNALNLHRYYKEHRRYIWVLYALALTSMIAIRLSGNAIRTDLSPYDTYIDLSVLAVMISLILIRNRWWHGAVLLALTIVGPGRWLAHSLS